MFTETLGFSQPIHNKAQDPLANFQGAPLFVVANLPYSITTDALISLVKHPGAIRYAQVMVQREAAERIVATVGSKDYSVLSVMLQAFCHVKQLYLVPPTAFYPPPKVVSSIVELDFKENSENIDVMTLLDVVKESFRQRKRALKHSLKAYLQQRRLPLPLPWSKLRAEQVSPSDFLQLSKLMSRPKLDLRGLSVEYPTFGAGKDPAPAKNKLVEVLARVLVHCNGWWVLQLLVLSCMVIVLNYIALPEVYVVYSGVVHMFICFP